MSTVADSPPPETAAPHDGTAEGGAASAGPDLNRLEDRTPEWLRMSRGTAGWTALVGLLYLVLSYQPLYHTDLWGHLSYGRWIWEQGHLPETEPLLPLCAGVPMVDTAWLSQLIGYGMYRQFGVTAMQFLYAITITAAWGLLLGAVLRRTQGSVAGGLVTVLTFGLVNYHQLLIVRPQLAGLTLFVSLFVLLVSCRWRRGYWGLVPLMFALWANLHGSWVVGLGLLAALCAGRAIDIARRTGRLWAPFADRTVRRLFVLTELAALAVLVNPYGVGLYAEVVAIAGNANLQDLVEWEPLTLRMSQGKAAATAALALMFAYRFSPRRVTAAEVLLLAGLGAAALSTSRMIHWWAPLAAYYLGLHTAAIVRGWRRTDRAASAESTEPTRNGLMSVVTVGLIWIFFAYTPFGFTVLHGQPEKPADRAIRLGKSTSAATPITAVGYLRRHPIDGLIYNSYEWGDFLLFGGPRELQVFTNSHAHLIPPEVWEDSLTILHGAGGWEDKLDRYGVNGVVLNAQTNETLIRLLKRATDIWEVAFEDRVAVVFRRRTPI